MVGPSIAGGGRSSRFTKSIIVISFLVGSILGGPLANLLLASHRSRNLGPHHGSVQRLSETAIRNTVHVDEKGRPITKQQLLEPFVIPNYAGFSIATFKPGQTMMPVHSHESMHEIFYVVEGAGIIRIGDVDHKVEPGTFLHVAPHEEHGIWVPEDSKEGDLKMAVSGVTVGEIKKKR